MIYYISILDQHIHNLTYLFLHEEEPGLLHTNKKLIFMDGDGGGGGETIWMFIIL